MSKNISILGSGIIGLCAGYHLLKKGYKVTFFDKNDPAKMASYGNAGHFSPYAVLQFNRPDILINIPQMLFRKDGPLSIDFLFFVIILYSTNSILDDCFTVVSGRAWRIYRSIPSNAHSISTYVL